MIGFIIWVIGVVLAVKAVLEIMRWPVDGVKKLLVAIIIRKLPILGHPLLDGRQQAPV